MFNNLFTCSYNMLNSRAEQFFRRTIEICSEQKRNNRRLQLTEFFLSFHSNICNLSPHDNAWKTNWIIGKWLNIQPRQKKGKSKKSTKTRAKRCGKKLVQIAFNIHFSSIFVAFTPCLIITVVFPHTAYYFGLSV